MELDWKLNGISIPIFGSLQDEGIVIPYETVIHLSKGIAIPFEKVRNHNSISPSIPF